MALGLASILNLNVTAEKIANKPCLFVSDDVYAGMIF